MLYELGPWDPAVGYSKKPVLHVGYLEHVLCKAPLVPCFLDGSSTNTIPHSKGKKARGSPTENATRTQEQAMEVLFLGEYATLALWERKIQKHECPGCRGIALS